MILLFAALMGPDTSPVDSRFCQNMTVEETVACTYGEARVLVVKQSSAGFSEGHLTTEIAEAIGAEQLKKIKLVLAETTPNLSTRVIDEKLKERSILVMEGGRKIVQTKFLLNDVPFAIGYAAFRNDEFTRILCVAYDPSRPVNLPGLCAQTVASEFNFRIGVK